MTIKAIIFDLGGVIVELDYSRFFRDVIVISPIKKPDSLLLDFWRQSDIYHQGKISDKEFYKLSCELLRIDVISQDEFFTSFNSVISGVHENVIDLIKKIRSAKKYKLLLLSNINMSHWNYLKSKKWGFLELFDEIVLSHELKMSKPDPKMFQYAIKKAGCKPEEILFIDDGLNNIQVARNLGINAIHFTDINILIEELKKLKISLG